MKSILKGFGAALSVALPLLMQASAAAAATSSAFDPALVQRGAYLAKAGDCAACHTAPKGKPFAGGLPMNTPMGQIYTTNITPDPQTGIGRYTEQDFARAMREGVAKDGHNLYPAMPYPSYAKVNDEDMRALYAFFMSGVAPVQQANRESDIKWPMNMRWPLKLWNMVFLEKGVYQNKPGKDVAWNRGAYLIQGLGHCGSCHTPRGIAFQEKALDESGSAFLTGSLLDGWFATNLTGEHNVGLGRWNDQDLQAFLKTGANRHATAFGSVRIRLDDERDQQQHPGAERCRHRGDDDVPEVAAAGRRQRRAALHVRSASNQGVAQPCGKRCRCARLHCVLHALPRRRRARLRADARAACRQSERAGERRVVADQRHAQRHRRSGDRRHSRAVSNAEVRAGAQRSADRRRAHFRARRLEQRRAGSHGRRGSEAAQVDTSCALAPVHLVDQRHMKKSQPSRGG